MSEKHKHILRLLGERSARLDGSIKSFIVSTMNEEFKTLKKSDYEI